MATGISTPLGYSINTVGGLLPRSEIGLHPLSYELGLTSYPPTFSGYGNFISPLEHINKYRYHKSKNSYGAYEKKIKNVNRYRYSTGRSNNIGSRSNISSRRSNNIGSNNNKLKCVSFLKNRNVNPYTGRPIKKNGSTYNRLVDKCKRKGTGSKQRASLLKVKSTRIRTSTSTKKKITKNMCMKFLESNKTINPITNRKIIKDGPVYNLFMKKCMKHYEKEKQTNLSVKQPEKQTSLSIKRPEKQTSEISTQYEHVKNDVSPIFIGKKPQVPIDVFDFFIKEDEVKKNNNNQTTKQEYPEIKYPPQKTYNKTTEGSNKPYPEYIQPPPVKNESNGVEYEHQDRQFISFNGKKFVVGSKAVVNSNNEYAYITNIGPKQILLRKDLNSKEKRLSHPIFIDLNK